MEPKYAIISQNDSVDFYEDIGSEVTPMPSRSRGKMMGFLLALLALLSASNLYFAIQWSQARSALVRESYLGLPRNIPTPIPHDNRTLDDPMWDGPEYDTMRGMVALKDDFVAQKGLLPAQRWPWDKSKSIYVFHGMHSMHCVMLIRDALREFRDNRTQTWPFSHVTHCLHTLREDAMCSADDLPRYTGALNAEAGKSRTSSGTGEVRMCRDWNKLMDFALKNSACYHRPLDRYAPVLERYKSCPDGSKPWEKSGL